MRRPRGDFIQGLKPTVCKALARGLGEGPLSGHQRRNPPPLTLPVGVPAV